jgi:hypothetical protein
VRRLSEVKVGGDWIKALIASIREADRDLLIIGYARRIDRTPGL